MTAEQVRDLVAGWAQQHKYEQDNLSAAKPTAIDAITPGDRSVAVAFRDGTRAVLTITVGGEPTEFERAAQAERARRHESWLRDQQD